MRFREPAVAYNKQKITASEYLNKEKKSREKHEFYRGEVFAMAGASGNHNVIFSNVFWRLGFFLNGKPCRPFGSDMRIHIPENTLYTYPDISVFCRDISDIEDTENLIKPTILIEILCSSTSDYDREDTFKLYRDIPSALPFNVL